MHWKKWGIYTIHAPTCIWTCSCFSWICCLSKSTSFLLRCLMSFSSTSSSLSSSRFNRVNSWRDRRTSSSWSSISSKADSNCLTDTWKKGHVRVLYGIFAKNSHVKYSTYKVQSLPRLISPVLSENLMKKHKMRTYGTCTEIGQKDLHFSPWSQTMRVFIFSPCSEYVLNDITKLLWIGPQLT